MELEEIILTMDNLKDKLDKLRPLREDSLNILNQKLKLDWNYISNSIEGNTLSKSETKSFILYGITAKDKPFRDYIEMRGHNNALNKLYQIVDKDLKITEKLIQEFHEIILVKPYTSSGAEINPGKWKSLPNYLISPTGERIDFVAPEFVPKEMNKLINWLNNHIAPPKRKKKKYDLHPLIIAAGFHTEFIKIHPFGDGNGRMARILTNLILMLCGYVPAIIKLDNRENYYVSINTSSLDKPENLAIVLGQAIVNTLDIAIKAAKGESIEEDNDIDKELALLDKRIKDNALNRPLKTKERAAEIVQKDILPFYRNLLKDLSKFNPYFESNSVIISFNGQSDSWLSDEVENAIVTSLISNNKEAKVMDLNFSYRNIKNIPGQITFNIIIRTDFEREKYTIYDQFTNQTHTYFYNQSITKDSQEEWSKKIQKSLLAKIKQHIDPKHNV